MGNGLGGIKNEGVDVAASGEVSLSDGWAVCMGDGVFIVGGQEDEWGVRQSVVLNETDLSTMAALLASRAVGHVPPSDA